ncbi:hypothetical protein Bbelb_328690 [Branchiostoma belcheri]|nr:hypothetical protein Bbelb_328690 [Branchiostoma belcheri]
MADTQVTSKGDSPFAGCHVQSSHLTRCEHQVIMAGRQDRQTVDVNGYFDKVIKGVSHKWDDLARNLGFNENEIKGIRTDQPDQDHRCREVLTSWRNREGREATLQVLKQALIDIGEKRTAESLEGQKTRKKRKRRRKPKAHQEDDSTESSSSTGNDSHDGPSPSHNYFPPVAKAVGSSWGKFAVEQLGLTAEDVVNIQVQHPSSTERQALQALELWRDRRGRKACRVKLAGALRRGGFLHTAEELDRYNGHEVKVNGLNTEQPAYIPKDSLQWTGPTHKKRKTRDSCGCARQIKQESEQSYHVACAESNGTNGRNKVDQRAGTSSNGTQHLSGTEHGHETNSTSSRSSQQHESSSSTSSSSTSGEESDSVKGPPLMQPSNVKLEGKQNGKSRKRRKPDRQLQRKLQSRPPRPRKRLKADPEAGVMPGPIKEEADKKDMLAITNPDVSQPNAALRKAERGCVFCHLDFADVSCFDTFWRGYTDGSLSDTLTRELITDDMRAAEGGADLYIHVRVLHSATEEGDFSDQDPSGTAGRGPPHPGPSGEHTGQGPPAPGSGNHGDDTPPGYHGDGPGGLQVSGGGDVIQVKREPAEQVPSCCMMGNVKSEIKGELAGPLLKREETEIMGELAGPFLKREETELDRQLATVADHLGSMWERLALSLGFTTDYIRDLTASQPPSLRPHQLICDWMERNAGDVTLERLVQALRDAGIHQVADAAASGQLFETAEQGEAEKEKPEDDMFASSPGRKTSPAKAIDTSSSSEEDTDEKGDETDCDSAKGKADWDLDTANPADGRLLLKRKRPDGSSSDSISSSDEEEEHQGAAVLLARNTKEVPEYEEPSEPSAVPLFCTSCKQTMQAEYSYICTTCEWGLQLKDVETLQPSLSPQEVRRRSIERCIQALVHACQCRDTNCLLPSCRKIKRVVQHTKSCKRKTTETQVKTPECTFTTTLYPTGEDALAWNDCLQDFFKTNEDTARSIQESWPSNLLVKHLIRDSIRQSLIAFWVAHTVRTRTDSTDLLRVCAENSDHLPITCCSLAHLLSRTDSPPTHLQQFFLPQLPNLEEIDLSQNNISYEAVPGLAEGLGSCQNLKKGQYKQLQLKVGENDIYSDLVSLLCNRKDASQVTKLDLTSGEHPWADVTPLRTSDVHLLLQFLPQLPNLQELALRVSCQGEEEAEHINQLYGVQPLLRTLKLKLRDCSLHKMTSLLKMMLQQFPLLEAIDLSGSDISDEAVAGLAEGLSSCQRLKHVNLTGNKISNKGALLLLLQDQCKFMKVKTAGNNISDNLVSLLADRQNASQVINLSLMPGEFPLGTVHPLTLTAVHLLLQFLPQLPNLQELALCVSCQGEGEAEHINQLYGTQPPLRTLKLTLRDWSLDKMTRLLTLMLERFPPLEAIDLSHSDISDEAVPSLAEGLGSYRNLKKVDLSYNKLSDRGDFLPPLPNLEVIDLSYNKITDEAVPSLTEGLSSCQNLKKVNLSHNKMSGIGDFLPPLPNLEEIDLSNIAISDEAVPGLAEGLGSCPKLKKVDLSCNYFSDVGKLMNAFINLPFLTHVYLYLNSIRDESLPAIAAWLKVSTAVERVDLDGNRFSAEGVRDFVRTMKGKAYSWCNVLLYDGSLADVSEDVQSGGEGARREEQQWGRLRSWSVNVSSTRRYLGVERRVEREVESKQMDWI